MATVAIHSQIESQVQPQVQPQNESQVESQIQAPAKLAIASQPFFKDLLVSTLVPLACYRTARHLGASEMTALVCSTVYPCLTGVLSLLRNRQANPLSVLVLLGIVTSMGASLIGGTPQLLLLRESLLTLMVGLACFATLATGRPLMFFFARHMVAGTDAAKRARFMQRAEEPAVRAMHRRITAVWGAALTLEFCVKAALVSTLPVSQVLLVGPLLVNATLMATMLWTVRYARSHAGERDGLAHSS